MSAIEMLRYLNRFRAYRIDARHVLDKSNVLYSDYYYHWLSTRMSANPTSSKKSDTTSTDRLPGTGPYILLPRKNDWNTIRWYVRVLLAREG
jgi:hypothetical protein